MAVSPSPSPSFMERQLGPAEGRKHSHGLTKDSEDCLSNFFFLTRKGMIILQTGEEWTGLELDTDRAVRGILS